MDKLVIDYRHYGYLVEQLTNEISTSSIDIHAIYGPPRGGLPIAVHLSHNLNKPLLSTLAVTHYPKHTILVVDDVADTGQTLIDINDQYGGRMDIIFATIFYKRRSLIKPCFYVQETDKWIVFPWESESEKPNSLGY